MKFKITFIFALMIIYFALNVDSKRIRRKFHRHRQNPPQGVQSNNVSYQFLMGALAEISGAYSLIDNCSKIIPGWATVTADAEEKKDSVEEKGKEVESTFEKIVGYLGTALEYVCKVKDKIIEFFTGKKLRWYRLFLQGKVHRKFKWDWDGLLKSASDSIKSVGSAIAAGAIKLKDAVVDGIDYAKKKATEVGQFIMDKLKGLFQPLIDLFEKIKTQFEEFLSKHPLLKMWYDFVVCFLKNDGISAVKGLKEKLTGFVATITALSTPVGWIKLVVNLICGWKDLLDGWNFFKVARTQKEKPKKYNFYGRMIGKWVNAIAG